MPSESNPLLDVLLARGINGESPQKQLANRKRSRSASPVKNKASQVRSSKLESESKTVKPKAQVKSKASALTSKKPLPKTRTTKTAKTRRNAVADILAEESVAGT